MANIVKVTIQVLEIGIGLTIALYLGKGFRMLIDSGMFSTFSPVFDNIVYLFGFDFTSILVYIMTGVLIVMFGRRVMSWASNNGGQTPNNNGN